MKNTAEAIGKLGSLAAVDIAALVVIGGQLHQSHSVEIVGDTPSCLPVLTIPPISLNAIRSLLPLDFVITLFG